MKKIILIICIAGILIVGIDFMYSNRRGVYALPAGRQEYAPATTASQAATIQKVIINNFAFSPATLTIKIGSKVTWTNTDSVAHSATAEDNSFDTGILNTGQSKTITFTKAGTYVYHCSVHPDMTGKIIVK